MADLNGLVGNQNAIIAGCWVEKYRKQGIIMGWIFGKNWKNEQ